VARLERELADPENFGSAKSMVMLGMERGFDMSTEEGINAWFSQYNQELGYAPPVNFSRLVDEGSPRMRALSPKPRTDKDRNRSKTARASRKRNRKK
jgi:hypothetical protein